MKAVFSKTHGPGGFCLWEDQVDFSLFPETRKPWWEWREEQEQPGTWDPRCNPVAKAQASVCRLPSCECRIAAVQSLSRVRLSATPWTAAWQASLSPTVSQSLLKLESYDFTIQQVGSPEVPTGTDEATQPKPLLSLLEDGTGKTEASQTTAA